MVTNYRVFNGVDNVDPGIWFNTAEARNGATATRQTSGFMNVTRGEGRLCYCIMFYTVLDLSPINMSVASIFTLVLLLGLIIVILLVVVVVIIKVE